MCAFIYSHDSAPNSNKKFKWRDKITIFSSSRVDETTTSTLIHLQQLIIYVTAKTETNSFFFFQLRIDFKFTCARLLSLTRDSILPLCATLLCSLLGPTRPNRWRWKVFDAKARNADADNKKAL